VFSLTLFFLVAIRSSALFTLVRRYLVSFTFFTTWHMQIVFKCY